jgi:plasmid stabilization system protein ParE
LGKHIANDSLDLAARILDDLRDAMQQLSDHPLMGHGART